MISTWIEEPQPDDWQEAFSYIFISSSRTLLHMCTCLKSEWYPGERSVLVYGHTTLIVPGYSESIFLYCFIFFSLVLAVSLCNLPWRIICVSMFRYNRLGVSIMIILKYSVANTSKIYLSSVWLLGAVTQAQDFPWSNSVQVAFTLPFY